MLLLYICTGTNTSNRHLGASYVRRPEYFRVIAWFSPTLSEYRCCWNSHPLGITPFLSPPSPLSMFSNHRPAHNTLQPVGFFHAQRWCEWFNICPVMSWSREEENASFITFVLGCRQVITLWQRQILLSPLDSRVEWPQLCTYSAKKSFIAEGLRCHNRKVFDWKYILKAFIVK